MPHQRTNLIRQTAIACPLCKAAIAYPWRKAVIVSLGVKPSSCSLGVKPLPRALLKSLWRALGVEGLPNRVREQAVGEFVGMGILAVDDEFSGGVISQRRQQINHFHAVGFEELA